MHFTTTSFPQLLDEGQALDCFEELVKQQDGVLEDIQVAKATTIHATTSGYVSGIDANRIARVIPTIGGARATAEDKIDHKVGIRLLANVGDSVENGQPIANLHIHEADDASVDLINMVKKAFTIEPSPLDQQPPLVFETVYPT